VKKEGGGEVITLPDGWMFTHGSCSRGDGRSMSLREDYGGTLSECSYEMDPLGDASSARDSAFQGHHSQTPVDGAHFILFV
jgi:hypothetical protein